MQVQLNGSSLPHYNGGQKLVSMNTFQSPSVRLHTKIGESPDGMRVSDKDMPARNNGVQNPSTFASKRPPINVSHLEPISTDSPVTHTVTFSTRGLSHFMKHENNHQAN